MNTIHRYVFLSTLGTCTAAVALLVFVLMLGNALKELIGPAIAGQLPFDTLLRLLGLMIPVVASYALPMGMLLGILLVLGRMSSDHEITALRAAGLSVAWLSAPILILALLGVALTLAINFQFMPVAKVSYETELRSIVRKNPVSFIVAKTFVRDFPGMVLFTDAVEGARLKNFWLWELDSQGRVMRAVRAQSCTVAYNEQTGKVTLTLENAVAEVRNAKDPENFQRAPDFASWQHTTFALPLYSTTNPTAFNKKLQWLTLPQLLAERERLRQHAADSESSERYRQMIRVQMAIQEKFATAFSVLSFALVAIPLGIKVSRRETSANLGIGLALAMAYYFVSVVVGWGENRPWLRPDLLIWLPNIGFQALGLWLFRKS